MTQSEEPQKGLTARSDVHKRHAGAKGIASRFKSSKSPSPEGKPAENAAEDASGLTQDDAAGHTEAEPEPAQKGTKKFAKRKPLPKQSPREKPVAQDTPDQADEASKIESEPANEPGDPSKPNAPDAPNAPDEPNAPDNPDNPDKPDAAAPPRHRVAGHQAKRRLWPRVLVVVVSCLVAAAAAIAILFAWDRWWRYDDAADLQGQWYAVGSTVPFTVTADTMIFDEKTSYAYQIDTTAKTITYSLAEMKGQGRYWFANDRTNLVIVDGDSFTATSTAFDDFGRTASETVVRLFGGQPALPEGDGVVVLRRDPDPDALAAQAAEAERKAQEEAEAQKKAEEEAARIAAAEESGSTEEGAPPGGFANESMGMFE